MNTQTLDKLRQQKNEFFRSSAQSPLSPEKRKRFTGLRYYPYNSALDLKLAVLPFVDRSDVQLKTTTGENRWFRRYGKITFAVHDETARLTLFQTGATFFLPFVDASAGVETYSGGRYLEPKQLAGFEIHVDFNQAYNPFCAFSDGWSCPITPAENRLRVPIAAGEKIPWSD